MNILASIKEAEFTPTTPRALADSYLSEGCIGEARSEMRQAIDALSPDETDELLACRNLLCKVERADNNLTEALRIHLETYPLVELSTSHLLKARFHNGLGITYRKLAAEYPEYLDRALIAFEAFRYHAECAGDEKEAGRAINNIALVLCQIGRTEEARSQLSDARRYFTDPARLAEIDETEAQVCLQEKKPLEALDYALSACRVFLAAGEKKLMNDSLPTLLKAIADYRCEG